MIAEGARWRFVTPRPTAIVQAMIANGVIGDFRAPDVARFGFTPLYLRFVDVYDAVERLVEVMGSRAYEDPAYRVRNAVT